MPFELDKDIQYLYLPKDDVTSKYLQSIHYTDKVFGEFYNNLKVEGLLDNTVLVIYGDHEGIHKYHETSLPDNNYEIPFIVHIPGMKGFEVNKIGGEVDIMPTLAYLLEIGTKKYSSKVEGRNLFSSQSICDLIIRGNYFNVKKSRSEYIMFQ